MANSRKKGPIAASSDCIMVAIIRGNSASPAIRKISGGKPHHPARPVSCNRRVTAAANRTATATTASRIAQKKGPKSGIASPSGSWI
ncbi:hypothetical protein D3C74_474620 [compost metagenome]